MPTLVNVETGDDKARAVTKILFFKPSAIDADEALDSRRKPISAEKLARMVESLKGPQGQLQPILVRQRKPSTRVTTIVGRTRHRAGLLIEAEDPEFRLLARVVECSDQQAFEMALEENLLRHDLDPVDKAMGAKRLLGYGWEKARVAEKFGVTPQAIDSWVSILTLPESVLDRVSEGSLPVNGALLLVGKQDAEAEAIAVDAERLAALPISDAVTPASEWTEADMLNLDGDLSDDIGDERAAELRGENAPQNAHKPVIGIPGVEADSGASDAEDATTGQPGGKLFGSDGTTSAKSLRKSGKSKAPKAAKSPKLSKNNKPIVRTSHVAEAARQRGHVTRRTWTDIRTVLESCDDIVSRAIMEFYAGGIEEKELRRVLEQAADDMEVMDRKRETDGLPAGKTKVKSKASAAKAVTA